MRRSQVVLSYSLLLLMLLAVPLPVMAAEQRQGTIHIVQRGDNLTAIANRYRTTPQAIANANNLVNMNLIYVGQRLTIPRPSSGDGHEECSILTASHLIRYTDAEEDSFSQETAPTCSGLGSATIHTAAFAPRAAE